MANTTRASDIERFAARERERREYHSLSPKRVWTQRHASNIEVVAEVCRVNDLYRWRVFDGSRIYSFEPCAEGNGSTMEEAKQQVFMRFTAFDISADREMIMNPGLELSSKSFAAMLTATLKEEAMEAARSGRRRPMDIGDRINLIDIGIPSMDGMDWISSMPEVRATCELMHLVDDAAIEEINDAGAR